MDYSFRKVISTDWPSLAASIGIPMSWAFYFIFPIFKKSEIPFPLWFPLILSFLLIVWLLCRIRRIHLLFLNGDSSEGRVTYLILAKDRGRLEFEFEYQGKLIRSWMPIHQTKEVLSLKTGQIVEVLFDKTKPTTAIIKHLFEK